MCGSAAVSAMELEQLDRGYSRLTLRCGACQTWRAHAAPARRAQAVGCALIRLLEGDRREIDRAARRAEPVAGGDRAPALEEELQRDLRAAVAARPVAGS